MISRRVASEGVSLNPRPDLVPEGDKFNRRGHRPRVDVESMTNPVQGLYIIGLFNPYRVGRVVGVIRGRCPRRLNLSLRGKEISEIDSCHSLITRCLARDHTLRGRVVDNLVENAKITDENGRI